MTRRGFSPWNVFGAKLSIIVITFTLLTAVAPAVMVGGAGTTTANLQAIDGSGASQFYPLLSSDNHLWSAADLSTDGLNRNLETVITAKNLLERAAPEGQPEDGQSAISSAPEDLEYASLRDALEALLTQHNQAITPSQDGYLAALSELSEHQQSALQATIEAFIEYQVVTERTIDTALHGGAREPQERLAEASGLPVAPIAEEKGSLAYWIQFVNSITAVRETGTVLEIPTEMIPGLGEQETIQVPVDPILHARAKFLVTLPDLADTLQGVSTSTAAVLDFCPAFSIDLDGLGNTYTLDCALQIDLGGNDIYKNNAGGNRYGNVLSDSCGSVVIVRPPAAAALIDLGGNDVYDSGEGGVNGGACLGSGLLVDHGGNDIYTAERGANGAGVIAGVGLLLDTGGTDKYTTDTFGFQPGANGGAHFGVGQLIDASGSDMYTAGGGGTNGGADGGHGLLLDVNGSDEYSAGFEGTNGGAWQPGGVGLLLDLAGPDDYEAGGHGANGGGWEGGVGTLIDCSGDDEYVATDTDQTGVNGGGGGGDRDPPAAVRFPPAGIGLLYDGRGTDQYTGPDASGQDVTGIKGTVGIQFDDLGFLGLACRDL